MGSAHHRRYGKASDAYQRNVIIMPNGERLTFNPHAKCRHCGEGGCPRRWCNLCEAVTGYECKPCHDEMVHGVTFLPGNAEPVKLHSYTKGKA